MAETTTIDKLVDLFHCSRRKGEAVQLFLESKNGKDTITFSINPTGLPAGGTKTWSPSPVSPTRTRSCSRTPLQPMLRRKKTPSTLRRDQKRKEEFFAKKAALASVEVKEDLAFKNETTQKANLVEPVDEITLTEMPDTEKEVTENEIINIVGEYKNPQFKPWSVVNPEEEVKNLWKNIEEANKIIGIKEIGEGSTCFEHCYEFWGSWKIETGSKLTTEVLKSPNSWPEGTRIRDLKVKSSRE